MSDIAIRGMNLSKRYQLGEKHRYLALRDVLANAAKAPLRMFGRSGVKSPSGETRDLWALRDVSFEVRKGEVVGLIGRNGAGKSTLLKILARVTKPTSGTAKVRGRLGSLLEVGSGFHPELTGRENVYLSGATLGMRKSEIAGNFDAILAFAEVEKFIDTPLKHYSSGMQMRLAFAVAAHLNTEILLIDEVLAVGDAQFQKKCLSKMGEVSHEGRTVILVSHYMNVIEQMCQRVILMQSGSIHEDSTDVRSIVVKFAFGSEGESSSIWTDDGSHFDNRYFRPTRFAIVNQYGEPMPMPIANDQDAWIQIEGEIRQQNALLNVGYAVYSENGHLLYWSYQTDDKQEKWPRFGVGSLRLRSRFPPRLFNEGRLRVEMIAGLHFGEWLLEPGKHAPSIFLSIQGGLSNSPFWITRRPGLLAPVIRWERIDSDRETAPFSVEQELPLISQSSFGSQAETNTRTES